MENVVNYILSAQKKIFVMAFLAVFSSFYTEVWGDTDYSRNGITAVYSGTVLTISAGSTGVMPNYKYNGTVSEATPWNAAITAITEVVINEGITYIGKDAFRGASKLAKITLPTSLDSVGENAFYGCSKMANIYYKGTPAQWVSIGLFHNCSHPFRDSGSDSRKLYFYGITTSAPSTVFIEPTITKIKKQVFNNVKSISCICIPGTVESIGNYAFFNCSGLTEIIINRHQAPSLGTGAFNGIGSGDPSNVQLYKPSTNSGYDVSPWSTFTETLSETSPCATSGTLDEGSIPWTLDTCGILTIDARGIATKSIEFNKAGRDHPWRRFRRMVYKIVLKGEITDIGFLGKYHYGLSEILLDQTTVPTSGTDIGYDSSTKIAYDGLFNKRDKLTLSIKSTSEGHANLSTAPWNDKKHWNIVVRTCPDWSLHYGTDKIADWDEACFTYTGSSNEWQIEDFVIPDKPNWYVDNAAGNDAKKKLSTWGDLYFAASQGDGTRPMVGNAVGAVGTVRIYDNSDWNNRYAGFIPNGYVLKIGSNKYSFALEDGNEYRSEIIEYSGSNARDNVSVGIVDANGDFVSTDNTSEMQHIFLHVGNNTTLWGKDGVTNFGLYDDTEGHKYFTCLMTAVPGENYLYEGWVPSNCTKVIFCRLKSSTLDWGTDNNNVHNYTNSLVLQDNQNLWTVTGWDGGDGSWSAYTQKGRFCIWQDKTVKNWGVCFRPCYEFNATENANWNNANNWKPQSVPTIDFDVFLNKPVTVNVTTAQAKNVIINQKGGNNGQLVVDAGQKLIVAGSIQKTTDGETYSATEANDIIIHSDATHGLGLGALVMGTHDGTNQATVNFTTLSSGTSEDNTSIAQYVGTPFNDETNILHNWYNSWVYGITYDGSNNIGWERVNEGQGMAPFKGYCVFSADGTYHNYWQQGTLVASKNQTISGLNCQSDEGTANPNNENLLANSWVAPIKINAMESSDFTNADATVYIFNSTSNSAYVDLGNYATYPVNSVADAAIIPSMQSFSVFTTGSGASVSLDYSKIVYDPAVGGTVPGPNKAPRLTKAETAHRMKLYVSAENGYSDMLYLLEHLDFEEGFENGWDGHKLFGESVAPQLYAVTPDGNMAVNCVPTYEGVVMGFKAGEQDNSYTFTFEYSDEAQPLYLLDINTNTYTQITSDTSYSFTTTDTDVHNRFVLTYNAPSTPTALETTPAVTTGKKVMYDNHLFILHNGRIFSAQGAMIQ